MSGGHQSLSEAAVLELCVSVFFLTGCGLAVWATGSATGFAVISLIPAWMAGEVQALRKLIEHYTRHDRQPPIDRAELPTATEPLWTENQPDPLYDSR